MKPLVAACLSAAFLSSCGMHADRAVAIETAYRYTQVEWLPESRHVRHGKDGQGIEVSTPDASIARGWWKPGVPAKGMPYQWGGFDTPGSFLKKLKEGRRAGDIGDAAKRKLGDAGTSSESCGIDCSGFVSRCWQLPRPYSTRELPSISVRLESWDELQPGDILLNHQHVILFARWIEPGKIIGGYEAGPVPVWRVNACGLPVAKLVREGYAPWRYREFD